MNLRRRVARIERRAGGAAECPLCRGESGPLGRVEFENGDEPVEFGACRCGGRQTPGGRPPRLPKCYRLPSREAFDAV
jgi:hypothetical protein